MRPAAGSEAAFGLAPHSGWAVAVAVAETADGIGVLLREHIELTAATSPESRQPYHAVESRKIDEAATQLAAWAATAERMAADALYRLAERVGQGGHQAIGAGVLESAGRKGSSLGAILASHALIHTADGNHFRDALARAAAARGLNVLRTPSRELFARVAAATGRSEAALQGLLAAIGREIGPPWRADEKAAALLGWLVLKQGARAERPDRVRH